MDNSDCIEFIMTLADTQERTESLWLVSLHETTEPIFCEICDCFLASAALDGLDLCIGCAEDKIKEKLQ